jgi:hypothetical protein
MANHIKSSGEGLALQVTKPVRSAALVEEDSEGNASYLADVRVFAFDHLLLIVDIEAVSTPHVTELVVAAAQDTESIFRAMDARVQRAGHGYQVQLPSAEDAGFAEGDRAPCYPGAGILVILRNDGTSAGAAAERLAQDLITIRTEQN